MHGVNPDAAAAGTRDGAAGQAGGPGAGRWRRPRPAGVARARRASRWARTRVDWPRVFAAAKIGGLKNYFIEQEQTNGWDVHGEGRGVPEDAKLGIRR